MSPSKDYHNAKVSEEAKIAAETIKANYKPDMDMQDLFSLAVMEYLRAYYPDLEQEVETTMERRRAARRGDEGGHQP